MNPKSITTAFPPASSAPQAGPIRHLALRGFVLLLALVTIAGWLWAATARYRAIRSLPQAQRLELLQRTEANVRQMCLPTRPEGLEDFCREQGRILLDLPECDEDCLKLAEALRPRATR